jgi:hypothetical protein
MRTLSVRALAGLFAAVLVSAPRAALACPVCFGALEGPVADGTNKAVLALLGVTVAVLASFGGFFIYLIRRGQAMPIPAELADFNDVQVDGRLEVEDTDEDDFMEGAA